jgi:catechol 2,3-dioxygenase-like lactoylglutathione lyase family enzyme
MKHEYKNIISFVWSTNIERSLRFYTEILGFNKGFASDDWIELAIPGLRTGYLALNRWTLDKPIAKNDFITLGVEDLDAFKKHLTASSVQFKGDTTEFYEEGIKMLKFYDPDGNTLTAAEVEPI